MTYEYKIANIRRASINGRAAKLFDVRERVGRAWLFAGTYSAPARAANKSLLQMFLRAQCYAEDAANECSEG